MANISFFKVLKSNIKCAFCKDKFCALRYFPERRKRVGTHYLVCPKDQEKRVKNVLKRPLQ